MRIDATGARTSVEGCVRPREPLAGDVVVQVSGKPWLLIYFAKLKLEATVVIDIPRYPWRGLPKWRRAARRGRTRKGERASG
jgi:hypothetical protein